MTDDRGRPPRAPRAPGDRLKLVPMQALGEKDVAARQRVRDEASSLKSLARERPFARRGIDAIRQLRLRHLSGRDDD